MALSQTTQSLPQTPRKKRASDLILEFKKYEDVVAITAVLKMVLSISGTLRLAERISIGGTLKRYSGSSEIGDLTPDMIATYRQRKDMTLRGLVFEIKWDVSDNDLTLRNELADLKRHFDELRGFPEIKGTISNHDVILVAHRDDALRYADVASKLFQEDPAGHTFLGSDRFAILSWERAESKDGTTLHRLEKVFGKIQHTDFELCLTAKKCRAVKAFDVSQDSARIFAVADAPPLIFRAFKLMRALANLFQDPRIQEQRLDEDYLHKWINMEFPPITMSSPQQISKGNLRETLQTLVKLHYNVSIDSMTTKGSSGNTVQVYRIKKKTPRGDLRAWLSGKLAVIEEKESRMKEKQTRIKKVRVRMRGTGRRRKKPPVDVSHYKKIESF